VAHDDGRDAAAGGAVVAVDVAAADAAGGHLNEDYCWASDSTYLASVKNGVDLPIYEDARRWSKSEISRRGRSKRTCQVRRSPNRAANA
jgi:hypothetical protein